MFLARLATKPNSKNPLRANSILNDELNVVSLFLSGSQMVINNAIDLS